MNASEHTRSTFRLILTRSYAFAILLLSLAVISGTGIPIFPAFAADREGEVDPFPRDVYVHGVGFLENPAGFCRQDPCGPGETSPSEALFNSVGTPLGLTWGEWQKMTATSEMRCDKDGATEAHVNLEGLIPGGVYSIFYRTFGPASFNPFCSAEERGVVVPNACHGRGCPADPDSQVLANAKGKAHFVGRIEGACLLDATQVFLDVIYHFDGNTYGQLPNRLEFVTQLQ